MSFIIAATGQHIPGDPFGGPHKRLYGLVNVFFLLLLVFCVVLLFVFFWGCSFFVSSVGGLRPFGFPALVFDGAAAAAVVVVDAVVVVVVVVVVVPSRSLARGSFWNDGPINSCPVAAIKSSRQLIAHERDKKNAASK